MLRDIPRIYLLFFAFAGIMALLIYWYTSMFQRGTDTTVLNEAILSAAVSEVDQSSRMYEGALLLAHSFEPTVWENIKGEYPEGSIVQFDYLFDTTHPDFNVTETSFSSPPYKIGANSPVVGDGCLNPANGACEVSYMLLRPIDSIRVKVREPDDNVGEWTYVSTVAVDAASR